MLEDESVRRIKSRNREELESAREFVKEAKKVAAKAVANMDPDQADAYRRAMTNRAIIDGHNLIETLIEITKDKQMPPNVRVTAAALVLDRALGKPIQEVKIDEESRTKNLSTSELIELAGRLGVAVGFSKARNPGTIIDAEAGTIPALPSSEIIPQ